MDMRTGAPADTAGGYWVTRVWEDTSAGEMRIAWAPTSEIANYLMRALALYERRQHHDWWYVLRPTEVRHVAMPSGSYIIQPRAWSAFGPIVVRNESDQSYIMTLQAGMIDES